MGFLLRVTKDGECTVPSSHYMYLFNIFHIYDLSCSLLAFFVPELFDCILHFQYLFLSHLVHVYFGCG